MKGYSLGTCHVTFFHSSTHSLIHSELTWLTWGHHQKSYLTSSLSYGPRCPLAVKGETSLLYWWSQSFPFSLYCELDECGLQMDQQNKKNKFQKLSQRTDGLWMFPSLQSFPVPPAQWAEDWGLHKREGLGGLWGGSSLGGCHLRQGDGRCGPGGMEPHSRQRLVDGRDSRGWGVVWLG